MAPLRGIHRISARRCGRGRVRTRTLSKPALRRRFDEHRAGRRLVTNKFFSARVTFLLTRQCSFFSLWLVVVEWEQRRETLQRQTPHGFGRGNNFRELLIRLLALELKVSGAGRRFIFFAPGEEVNRMVNDVSAPAPPTLPLNFISEPITKFVTGLTALDEEGAAQALTEPRNSRQISPLGEAL